MNYLTFINVHHTSKESVGFIQIELCKICCCLFQLKVARFLKLMNYLVLKSMCIIHFKEQTVQHSLK